MSTLKTEECRSVQYELEIDIAADADRVWKGITDQLTDWWLPDFHILGEGSRVVFEPWAGGRLAEENGERGLLWFTVLMVDPPCSIVLAGHTAPQYGGPATTLLTLTVEKEGKGTRLRIQDAIFGEVKEKTVASTKDGWKQLFTDGLKKFVEAQ